MVNMTFEIIFHEILCKFTSVAEALQTAIHVAGIAKVFKTYNSFSASEVFFLKVELFEGNGPSPNVLLFKLAFSLMIFPVLFEAIHRTILDDFTLTKL